MAKDGAQVDPSRGSRRAIGAVAIALIVVLFLLLFFRVIEFLEWIIGVAVVWLIANFLLKRLKSRQQTL
jgi:Ca2+/Na+ antiporter